MIKAVIFDVGGVLHGSSGQYIFQDIMQTLEITEEVLREAWSEIIGKLGRGEITESEFWRIFLEKTRSTKALPAESLFLREFIKHYNRHDDVISLVERLKNNKYTVAVLSNTIKPHADYQYEIGMYQNFDAVVLSHEVGMRKPGSEMYEYMLKKLLIEPEEAVFIDDRLENVEGAAEVGIHSILFKDFAQLEIELEKLGVKV